MELTKIEQRPGNVLGKGNGSYWKWSERNGRIVDELEIHRRRFFEGPGGWCSLQGIDTWTRTHETYVEINIETSGSYHWLPNVKQKGRGGRRWGHSRNSCPDQNKWGRGLYCIPNVTYMLLIKVSTSCDTKSFTGLCLSRCLDIIIKEWIVSKEDLFYKKIFYNGNESCKYT